MSVAAREPGGHLGAVHIEVASERSGFEIAPAEYARLLGLPRQRAFEGDIAQRAEVARAWYLRHGRPTVVARRVAIAGIAGETVTLATGECLKGTALARRLETGGAHALLALAVTAGIAVDSESQRLFADDKPDEAFFLDRYGAAVAEALVPWAVGELCRGSEPDGETVLPHQSPGCGGWDFEAQRSLLTLIAAGDAIPEPFVMLASGMLSPRNSLLAAAGVTRGRPAPSPTDVCRSCALTACGFRRTPYRGAA